MKIRNLVLYILFYLGSILGTYGQENPKESFKNLTSAPITQSSAAAGPNTCTDYAWAVEFLNNSVGLNNIDVLAASTDLNGNVVIAGHLSGLYQVNDVSLSATIISGISFTRTMFTASFSPLGNLNWIKSAIPSGFQSIATPYDLTIDNQGSVYVIGRYGSNTDIVLQNTPNVTIPTGGGSYIVKYTQNGTVSWVTYGVNSPNAGNIEGRTIDIEGNTLVATHNFTGSVSLNGSTYSTNSNQSNMLIAKVNPSTGGIQWTKTITTTNNPDYVNAAEVKVRQNEIFISGTYRGQISLNGQLYTNANQAGFISKLNSSGNTTWFKTIEDGFISSIELSNTCKGIYATGLYTNPFGLTIDGHSIPTAGQNQGHNIFVTSLDQNGTAEWLTPIHGFLSTTFNHIDNMDIDEYDNIYINANAREVGLINDDVYSGNVGINLNLSLNSHFTFTFKFLKNGSPVRVDDYTRVSKTTYDKLNNKYYLVGLFNGSLQLGGTTLGGSSLTSLYLAPAQQTPFAGVTNTCLSTCPGQPVALEAFAHYGSAITYKWEPNNFLDSDNLPTVNFNSNVVGIHDYIVTIRDASGCADKAHVQIEVLDNKPPNISLPGFSCINESNIFASVPDPSLGSWSASCGSCIEAATGEFFPAVAGLGNHQIFFTTACTTAVKSIDVEPDYTCCLNQTVINNAIILKGNYSQVALNVPSGSTVIIEDDVRFENMNLNWDNVKVYVEGRLQGGNVIGSRFELVKVNASFDNCSFQSTCNIMWKGIEVSDETELHMTKTTLRDAHQGVKLLDNTIKEVIINNCNFNHNYYSIYFETGELDFPISISNNRFNSVPKKFKIPYNFKNVNDRYYTEAHLFFNKGLSKLFPFTFKNNRLRNCKYGIYSKDDLEFGAYIFGSEFINCFTAGVHSKRNGPDFIGNAPTNDLLIHDSHFKFANTTPATPQFANLSASYGIFQSSGDLEVKNCEFVGSTNPFQADFGVNFSNPRFKLTAHNNQFNVLSRAIQIRTFGAHWLLLKQQGTTQLVKYGTEVSITSNYFRNNDECIHFLSNKNLVSLMPQNPTGATSILPCPNGPCPEADIRLVKQNISCNEFVRTDNKVSYAVYVEPNTFTQHINGLGGLPAGNEIMDQSNSMRSIWNLGDIFKYRHYSNENLNALSGPFFNATFINSNIVANDGTCPGTAGVRMPEDESALSDNLSFELYPNPSSSGKFTLDMTDSDNIKTIQVLDIYGKIITEFKTASNNTTVDLSSYSKGMYLINVTDGKSHSTKKILFE